MEQRFQKETSFFLTQAGRTFTAWSKRRRPARSGTSWLLAASARMVKGFGPSHTSWWGCTRQFAESFWASRIREYPGGLSGLLRRNGAVSHGPTWGTTKISAVSSTGMLRTRTMRTATIRVRTLNLFARPFKFFPFRVFRVSLGWNLIYECFDWLHANFGALLWSVIWFRLKISFVTWTSFCTLVPITSNTCRNQISKIICTTFWFWITMIDFPCTVFSQTAVIFKGYFLLAIITISVSFIIYVVYCIIIKHHTHHICHVFLVFISCTKILGIVCNRLHAHSSVIFNPRQHAWIVVYLWLNFSPRCMCWTGFAGIRNDACAPFWRRNVHCFAFRTGCYLRAGRPVPVDDCLQPIRRWRALPILSQSRCMLSSSVITLNSQLNWLMTAVLNLLNRFRGITYEI